MASQAPGTPPASAAGPSVPGVLPASLDTAFRATSDIECVWVNRSCGVQTLESRFGSTAREVIYARLERYMDYEEEDEGSDENEDWDNEEEGTEDDEGDNEDDDDDDDKYDEDEYDDEGDDEGDDSDNVNHNNGNGYGNGNGNGNGNAVHNGEDDHSDGSNSSNSGGDSDNYGAAGLLQSGPLPGQSSTDSVFVDSLMAQISPLTTPTTLHSLLSMGAPLSTNSGLFGTFSTASAHYGLGGMAGTAGTGGPGPAAPPQECEPMHGSTIPRVARARVNLTALSQRYNLYFAVYQDKIHIYRPQPAPEILRGPQLILCPGPSSAAKTIGGYIDPKFPHQANHAIVGDLGSEEILLLGYDDGDVIAYYTRHICDYVERHSRRPHRSRRRQQQQQQQHPPPPPLKKPTPFFRQTVGISAWGLAIHAQSRLIAVSSNLFEVNVFAFALYPPAPGRPSSSATPTDRSGSFYRAKNASSFASATASAAASAAASASASASTSGKPLSNLESLRLRDRNWRILLPLEATGHNMPCIAFIDDDNGDAEKVVGVDIHGKAWFLDIWKVGLNRALVMLPPNRGERLVGWGILPLPARAFVKSERMPSAPSQKQGANSTASQSISHLMTLTNENDPPALLSASAVVCDSQLGQESAEEHSSDEDGSLGEENSADHDLILPVDDGYDLISHGQSSGESEDESQYDFANEHDSGDAASSSTSASSNSENEGGGGGGIRDTHGHCHCHRHHRRRGCHCRLDEQRNRHDFQLGSVICPSLSQVWSDLPTTKLITILRCAPQRQRMVKAVLLTGSEKTPDLLQMAERLSILRTFGTDAEFFTTSLEKPWGVFFSKMIEPPVVPNFVWDMNANYHRLSLLECIPEIGVVIVGGMFGRVAVLRLMRGSRSRAIASVRAKAKAKAKAREKRQCGGTEEDPDDDNDSGSGETLHRCFRTEWILPRRLEEKKKLRPSCCLLGIAVSPVPEDGASPWGLTSSKRRPQQEASKPPRRWRLILHYMDHTILQYYIEEKRPGPRRHLCVFSP